MKKHFFLAVTCIITALLFSCQNLENSPTDVDETSEIDKGMEIATKNLYDFLSIIYPETRSVESQIQITGFDKKNMKIQPDENLISSRSDSSDIITEAELYTITFSKDKKEGYAIVSGDENISKLYAYTEDGHITDTSVIFGLNQAIRVIEELYINDIMAVYYNNPLDSIVTRQANSYSVTSGPFTKLKWKQGTPYNASVPVNCGRIPGGKAYAGCVPLSVAMVIAYMEPYAAVAQNQVNRIRNMPRITINNKEESKIVADFMVKVGSLCQADYDCNAGTGATMPNASKALSYFGVLHDYKDGNIDTKKTAISLSRSYPVIAAGYDGKNFPHAWMIEGGIELINPGTIQNINYTHYYCNWGFDNGSDGFFAVGKHEDYIDPQGNVYRLVKSNRYIYVTGAIK